MSRLVQGRSRPVGFLREITSANDYAERIVKYIPSEILAAYIAINGILASVAATQGDIRIWVQIGVIALLLILTPLYFRLLAKPTEPTTTQMFVSTVAFVVWAYNLGGPFVELYPAYVSVPVYFPWIGSISLIIFTLVSGLVIPPSRDTANRRTN